MENKVYATDREIERAVNMYSVSDKEYQNVCVAYMYGESIQEADKTREGLTETEIANASDYMMTKGLPQKMREDQYSLTTGKRMAIEEKNGLSPIQAIMARDGLDKLIWSKDGGYDLESDAGRKKACDVYSKLMQNNLSSSAEKKMELLDAMAEHAGLKFHMENESQYMLPNALVAPRYVLVENAQDFAAAVESIPEDSRGLEQ